jgi:hypothetical protein
VEKLENLYASIHACKLVLIKLLSYRGYLVSLIPIGCPLALVELVYKGLH